MPAVSNASSIVPHQLGRAEQPAVWVSGFYGSGKSHLVRVLEQLWRDVELPVGDRARSSNDPSHPEIQRTIGELSTAGKRARRAHGPPPEP